MENKLSDLIGKVVEGVQTADYDGVDASELILFFTDDTTLTISEKFVDGWQGFSISLDAQRAKDRKTWKEIMERAKEDLKRLREGGEEKP